MAGVGIEIRLPGFDRLQTRLRRMTNWDTNALLDAIGAEVESQTKRRIAHEKTDPTGNKWPAWSKRYAKTRGGGHSLLRNKGNLLDSITHNVVTDGVEWGTNSIYGATHQFGRDMMNDKLPRNIKIPARPYLGLSPENEGDIEQVVNDWLEQEMAL